MVSSATIAAENLKYGVNSFKAAAERAPKLNPEAKKLILEALRSGEYAQTKGYLKVTKQFEEVSPGYCCLGVFSEVAMQNGVQVTQSEQESGVVKFIGSGDQDGYFSKSTAFLIKDVADWLGLDYVNGSVDSALMSINDNGGSFELIADLIEEHL